MSAAPSGEAKRGGVTPPAGKIDWDSVFPNDEVVRRARFEEDTSIVPRNYKSQFCYYTSWDDLGVAWKIAIPKETNPVFAVLPSVSNRRANDISAGRVAVPPGVVPRTVRFDYRFEVIKGVDGKTTEFLTYDKQPPAEYLSLLTAKPDVAKSTCTDVPIVTRLNPDTRSVDALVAVTCTSGFTNTFILRAVRVSPDNGATYSRWVDLSEMGEMGRLTQVPDEVIANGIKREGLLNGLRTWILGPYGQTAAILQSRERMFGPTPTSEQADTRSYQWATVQAFASRLPPAEKAALERRYWSMPSGVGGGGFVTPAASSGSSISSYYDGESPRVPIPPPTPSSVFTDSNGVTWRCIDGPRGRVCEPLSGYSGPYVQYSGPYVPPAAAASPEVEARLAQAQINRLLAVGPVATPIAASTRPYAYGQPPRAPF